MAAISGSPFDLRRSFQQVLRGGAPGVVWRSISAGLSPTRDGSTTIEVAGDKPTGTLWRI
jgi:hypothetical protein